MKARMMLIALWNLANLQDAGCPLMKLAWKIEEYTGQSFRHILQNSQDKMSGDPEFPDVGVWLEKRGDAHKVKETIKGVKGVDRTELFVAT